MEFKVGDRVEAIKPPNGVEEREADQIGLGRITAINADGHFGETHAVQLDSGKGWYYSEDRLRPIVSKPTPTPRGPQEKTLSERILEAVDTDWQERHVRKLLEKRKSITVGTQVRLTGVVKTMDSVGAWIAFPGRVRPQTVKVKAPFEALEVIRQPFKRGEVVYLSGWPTIETCPCRVLEDEHEGKVLLVGEVEGSSASYVEAGAYERRND